MTTLPPAGWYADPAGAPGLRYWDGRQWTQHYFAQASICPACRSGQRLPIIYGGPTQTHMALVMERSAVPGGAMRRLLTGEAPQWQCAACGFQWRGDMFTGGPGNSFQSAVVINGVTCTAIGIRAEKQYLTERFGLDRTIAGDPNGWQQIAQTTGSSGGRRYDLITIKLADQSEQTVIFDITEFFGNPP